MTPKVRSLDGVVCVLLCVGLHPCRLHVVLHKTSNLPDLQKSSYVSDEGGVSIKDSNSKEKEKEKEHVLFPFPFPIRGAQETTLRLP